MLSTDDEVWLQVYSQSICLNTTALATLRYHYLQGALNFVGCHLQRMAQVTTAVCNPFIFSHSVVYDDVKHGAYNFVKYMYFLTMFCVKFSNYLFR